MVKDNVPAECAWTDTELRLVGLVVEMMDVDPTYERLERVFEKALALVRSLKEGRRVAEGGTP